jgi:Domain of Unknown Function (DUF1080)
MTNVPRDKITLAMLAIAFGLGVAATACTPATPDSPATGGSVGTGGNVGVGSGGSSTTGTGGSPGSGGSQGAGSGGSTGSGGAGTGESGGVVGTGGSLSGNSGGSVGSGGSPIGTGGMVATGGRPGSGGGTALGGAGGSSAGKGCNWVHNPDGTWALGTPAPADKIVLFDGTSLSGWHKLNMPTVPTDWKLLPDKTMQVVPSGTGQAINIQSTMKFEDLCVHVEYMTPPFASGTAVQRQGNSGVYLKTSYEIQILDSHNLAPMIDGCGAVYQVMAPMVVACNMFMVWNTLEIEFKSSGWTGATKTKNAVFAQVVLNGKLVQMNVTVPVNVTQAGIPDVAGPQPLGLQDHLDLVSFRNIWVAVPRY